MHGRIKKKWAPAFSGSEGIKTEWARLINLGSSLLNHSQTQSQRRRFV
jgi:hypothetical protein